MTESNHMLYDICTECHSPIHGRYSDRMFVCGMCRQNKADQKAQDNYKYLDKPEYSYVVYNRFKTVLGMGYAATQDNIYKIFEQYFGETTSEKVSGDGIWNENGSIRYYHRKQFGYETFTQIKAKVHESVDNNSGGIW